MLVTFVSEPLIFHSWGCKDTSEVCGEASWFLPSLAWSQACTFSYGPKSFSTQWEILRISSILMPQAEVTTRTRMTVALLLFFIVCQDAMWTAGSLGLVGDTVLTSVRPLLSWIGTADAGGSAKKFAPLSSDLTNQKPIFCSRERPASLWHVKDLALAGRYFYLLSYSLCTQGESKLSNFPPARVTLLWLSLGYEIRL